MQNLAKVILLERQVPIHTHYHANESVMCESGHLESESTCSSLNPNAPLFLESESSQSESESSPPLSKIILSESGFTFFRSESESESSSKSLESRFESESGFGFAHHCNEYAPALMHLPFTESDNNNEQDFVTFDFDLTTLTFGN